jgi:hypothetical protein
VPSAVPPRFIVQEFLPGGALIPGGPPRAWVSRAGLRCNGLTRAVLLPQSEGSSAITPGDIQQIFLRRAFSHWPRPLCQLTPAYSSQKNPDIKLK